MNSVRMFSVVLIVLLTGMTIGEQATAHPIGVVARQQWSWDDFWQKIVGRRRQDPPLGSRGRICVLTPVPTVNVPVPIIWREKPLLVWQGKADRVEVFDRQTEQLMSRRLVRIGHKQMEYTGEPLLPGRVYDVKFFSGTKSTIIEGQTAFKIMSPREQKQIAQRIAGLSTEERANFWMEQGLWDEAVAEIYTVVQPSEEILQLRRKFAVDLCEKLPL
jgi:hypothetical protein